MTTPKNSSTGQAPPDSAQRRYFRIQEQQVSQAPINNYPQMLNYNQQGPANYQPRPHPGIYQQGPNIIYPGMYQQPQNYQLQQRNVQAQFHSLHLSQKYKGLIKIFCITSIIQDCIFFIIFLSFYIIQLYYLFLVMMVIFLVQITICISLLAMKKQTINIDIIKKEYSTAKMVIYFVAILSLGSSITCIALQYEKVKNTLQVLVVWVFIIIGLIYMIPKLIALCIISCKETPDDMLLLQQN